LRKVLVCDDNANIRQILREYLVIHGFSVVEAVDGVRAVEQVKEGAPDVVVLDFWLPHVNGLETAAILNGIAPQMPIVLLTLHDEAARKALRAFPSVAAVVSKSDGVKALMQAIKDVFLTADRDIWLKRG
jgi:CheY-like chemotaxis protein